MFNMSTIGDYIKEERKKAGLTQEDFAIRSGLGLRFVRELEQGKETVRLDSRWSQNIEKDMYIFKIIFPELLQKLKKGIFLLMTRIIWTENMQWQ